MSAALIVCAATAFAAPSDSRSTGRVESVLARHARAVGAVSNVEGSVAVFRGTFTAEVRTMRGSGAGSVELTVGPPDRWAVSWAAPGPGGVTAEACRRESGWSTTWAGFHRWTPRELRQKRIDMGPWLGTPVNSAYSSFKWIGEERTPGGSVAILEAVLAEGGGPDKLFFDESSGQLLRRDATRTVWILDDVYEDVSVSYRFEDYRDVSGSKRPFKVRLEAPLIGYELTFTESARAEGVDDSRFEPPP